MKLSSLLSLALGLGLSSAAWSVPVHNPNLVAGGQIWNVRIFNDAAANHVAITTDRICFRFVANVGMHMRYVWQSLANPNLRGWASQEGDEVTMHGDLNTPLLEHVGMQFELVTQSPSDMGAGHRQHWRESSSYGSNAYFGNILITREANSICQIPAPLAAPAADGLEKLEETL